MIFKNFPVFSSFIFEMNYFENDSIICFLFYFYLCEKTHFEHFLCFIDQVRKKVHFNARICFKFQDNNRKREVDIEYCILLIIVTTHT